MGYWRQSENGEPFDLQSDLIWGDQPADVMGAALKEIITVFQRDQGRLPTEEEVKAGLLLSLRVALERAV